MTIDPPLNHAPASTPPARKPGLHLKRPCLVVADLQRSFKLYQDILGFKLDYVSAASETSYLYTVFKIPKHGKLTFATLSTEHELRALALTEVKEVKMPRPQPPYAIGLVIQVAELATTMLAIEALGLEIMLPSSFTAPPNLVFTEQGFLDFDGHLIILHEVKVYRDEQAER